MPFLSELSRVWVTVEVPGTSPKRISSTYVGYSGDQLPSVPVDVASLEWLRRAAHHPEDYMASASPDAVLDISARAWPTAWEAIPRFPRI